MSDKSIKSVRRIFEILELFDRERRPLGAKDISTRLSYPLTSAHALLKSMQELGYADFDPPSWKYTPSQSFSSLLDWVRDFPDFEPKVLDFISALNWETKETVNLSRRVGTHVKIIYGLECVHGVGVSVKVGTLMPAVKSLTGVASLSALDDSQLDEFLLGLNANDPEQAESVDRKLFGKVFEELRQRGTVAKCDVFVQGIGAVCLPIQTRNARDALVIGVVGPSDRIREHEIQHRRSFKRLAAEFGIKGLYKLRNPRK